MKKNFIPWIFAILLAGIAGCGTGGVCIGTGGIIDVCKEDWTRAECNEWDAMQVNGANWNYSSGSCEGRGYTVQCSDGSYVLPSDGC